MIHLSILVTIGLLIFRVIWVIVTRIESIFQREQKQPTDNNSRVEGEQVSKVSETSKSKPKETASKTTSKVSTVKPLPTQTKKIVPQKSKEEPIKFQKSKEFSKVSSVQQPSKIISQKVNPVASKSQNSLSQSQKEEYEAIISQMKAEIEEYQRQKIRYIQRIEQIIQIVNQTQIYDLSKGQVQELPMENLKNKIAKSTNKIKIQKKQLEQFFENEKTYLINEYEEKIQQMSQKNKKKTEEYLKAIEEITQRVYELEQEKSQNQGNVQNIPSNEKQNQTIIHQKDQSAKQANKLRVKVQQLSEELDQIKKTLVTKENDAIQTKARLEAQIKSLTEQQVSMIQELAEEKQSRFRFEQELEEEVFKHQHDKIQAQESSKTVEEVEQLRRQLNEEKYLRLEEEKRTQETIEELKFCQEQLKNARETEVQLRAKLIEAVDAPKRPIIRKEDVEKCPEYMALKRKLEQLQGRKITLPENKSAIFQPSNVTPRETRQVSPTFQVDNQRTNSPNSDYRGGYRSGYNQEDKSTGLTPPLCSYIDKRYHTPNVKNTSVSSTLRKGAGSYLGETNILNEAQRNLIIHEVSALKKITIRKTALLYTSANKQIKPITDYLVGVPNLLVIVELANKNVIGAFTQNAFSKSNQFTHSTIMSKAMIFSLTPQTFIVNQNRGEAIHFEENILIWGHKQIVIDCNEPMELSADLNCEQAVYPTVISTQQFMGGETQKIPIVKIEAYRNFFG